jgi:hypothetical protein
VYQVPKLQLPYITMQTRSVSGEEAPGEFKCKFRVLHQYG